MEGQVPEGMRGKRVISLDLGKLIADAKRRLRRALKSRFEGRGRG